MAAVRVQSQVGDNGSGTGTIVLTPASPTTAGNLLVVAIGQYGGTPGAPSITDSVPQTWTTTAPALSSSPRGSLRCSIYYMPNSASVTSVTVTPSNVASAILLEYSGVDTAPTVVAVSAFTDQVGVTSWASNTINTTKTSLLLGFAWDIFLANASFAASGAWSAGARFNNATDSDDAWFEEQLAAAAASGLQAQGTSTSSEISSGIIAFSLPTAATQNPLPLLSPLTGLGIPGSPPVSQMLATGVEPNVLGYVSPLPVPQFLNPLSLVMGPVLFPFPAPYVIPASGVNRPITPDTGITATSNMTAAIQRLRPIPGATINVTSAVTAAIQRLRPIAGATINATSAVSAAVVRLRPIQATINATSPVTTLLQALRSITAATINATSTVTASFSTSTATAPFLLHIYTGTDRLWNIEQWLLRYQAGYTTFEHRGNDRLRNIEAWLTDNPINSHTFVPYQRAGVDRLWAIEQHLIAATT